MSLTAPLLLVALLSQAAVSASPADTEIVCSGPLPFSRAELQDALRPRAHLLGGVSPVMVRADGGKTAVHVGAVEREVELGGRVGEDAARIVALLALDLAQAANPLEVSATLRPMHAKREHPLRAGLTLLCPFDQSGWGAHLEPTVDVAVDVAGGVGAFVSAGYRQASASASASAGSAPRSLDMSEIPLRAGVTLRRRWLEMRFGGVVRPYAVDGAGSYRGTTWGGSISGATRVPLTAKLVLVLAAGLDAFRSRMVFAVDHETVLSTSWLAPWLGVGLAWEAAL